MIDKENTNSSTTSSKDAHADSARVYGTRPDSSCTVSLHSGTAWPKASRKFARIELLEVEVTPTPLKEAQLVAVSQSCLHDMGWDQFDFGVDMSELKAWLNSEVRWPGDERISTRYAGHQFGVWAGQLGDGRAISHGVFFNNNMPFEVQSKGSGQTPFSRFGDGKAVIRSSVREFLCSEAMHGLRIPTTRALALLTGSDEVQRETVERSALVARVFPTNLRFGHFEYCFHFNELETLKILTEQTRAIFYPTCKNTEEMLEQVMINTADLLAHWMSVGFCHGVMNTDNMSILGLTIDYGPFGFIEDMDLGHICNHSDHQGRYAFSQQPNIALWNLERLFMCFSEVVEITVLQEILEKYETRFQKTWLELFRKKLGLTSVAEKTDEEDGTLVAQLMTAMHNENLDYTYVFRSLCSYEMHHNSEAGGEQTGYENLPTILHSQSLKSWCEKYDQRLSLEAVVCSARQAAMKLVNTKYILRNYIAQEIIEDVELNSTSTNQSSKILQSDKINQWLKILSDPFAEHEAYESYALPTPENKKSFAVSCSS